MYSMSDPWRRMIKFECISSMTSLWRIIRGMSPTDSRLQTQSNNSSQAIEGVRLDYSRCQGDQERCFLKSGLTLPAWLVEDCSRHESDRQQTFRLNPTPRFKPTKGSGWTILGFMETEKDTFSSQDWRGADLWLLHRGMQVLRSIRRCRLPSPPRTPSRNVLRTTSSGATSPSLS